MGIGLFFEHEANWTTFIADQGWKSPDGTVNWQNPEKDVRSSYLYRQNFGNRAVRQRKCLAYALLTEYTDLDRYNHDARGGHVLFDDIHAKWFTFSGSRGVKPLQVDNLSAIDIASGKSGWEETLDPLANH